MQNKMKLTSRTFTGSSVNEVEEKANDWSYKFLRELRELRTAWNDESGMFNVKVTVVISEKVVV